MLKKIKDKESAIKLRVAGKSYKEIADSLGRAESTIRFWVGAIQLTPKQKTRLKKKVSLNGRRLGTATSEQWRGTRAALARDADSRYENVRLSKNALALVGAALYWAEGEKRSAMHFANSDCVMIALYLRWLRDILCIPDSQVGVSVYAHTNVGISKKEIQRKWGVATGLPTDRIKIYAAPVPKSSNQTKVGRLPYGTAHIKVKKAMLWRAHLSALLTKLGKDFNFVDQPTSYNSTKVSL